MTHYELWETKYEGHNTVDAPFPPAMLPCIEQFFRDVHPRLKPGRGVYDEVFNTELFFPLQRKKELTRMLELAGEPVTVMEIGADKGGGLYHWCMMPSVKNVIACEIRGTPYSELFEDAFPHIRFCWLDAQSSYERQTALDVAGFLEYEADNDGLIDVLFVDGDKLGMLKDFDVYLPLMRQPGGVVFLHDVCDTGGPTAAFESLRKRYRTEWIVDRSEGIEADRRHVRGEQPRSPWDGWLMHWHGRSCTVGVVHL